MKKDTYEKIILDETENVVYLSEIDTYRLLYMNRYCMELLGIRQEEDYVGRPCYEILQGRTAPCEFCTNSVLNEHSFYTWKQYSEPLNRWFIRKDKKIVLPDGRAVRLEIASDNTEDENNQSHLSRRLNKEETLLRCVQTLSGHENIQAAISELLKIIGEFYGGDRACAFELSPDGTLCNSICEWRMSGVHKKSREQEQIPVEKLSLCLDTIRKKGYFSASRRDIPEGSSDPAAQTLDGLQLDSLIAVPLTENGVITGLLGVSNPTAEADDLTLLTSVSYFIDNEVQKRKMTARLERMSYVDLLTGLFNRNKYMEYLHLLEEHPPASLGIVYMDLNGLKIANDTYGHKYGDHLIKKAADMLAHYFQPYVFRIGGDEFVAVCPDIVQDTFDGQVEELRKAASLDTQINVSIGSVWSDALSDPSALITEADSRMYLEKQSYYKQSIHGEYNHSSSLSHQVLKDISDGRFLIHLQPKVELSTGKVIGAEALVRRKDITGSLLMPGKFIPLYESEGLIRHIDFFVLESVCQMLRLWDAHRKIPVRITVNLSCRTLLEHDIVRKTHSLCTSYGIAPDRLCLKLSDITERAPDHTLTAALKQFRQAGFYISVSQEGPSGSRSFVELAPAGQEDATPPVSTAGEIENSEQLDRLGEAGFQYGQGYYYSSPVTVEEFEERFLYSSDNSQN